MDSLPNSRTPGQDLYRHTKPYRLAKAAYFKARAIYQLIRTKNFELALMDKRGAIIHKIEKFHHKPGSHYHYVQTL